MEKKLKHIMSNIFDLNEDDIVSDSSMENIEKWDSLGHLKLIMAVEENFGVSLQADDMIDLTSFSKIKVFLEKI